MPTKRKFGQLRLEGENPLAFVEADGVPIEPWTSEEEAAARTVGRAIKRYLETTAELANGRYQHLKGLLPSYLIDPGGYLVAVCADGIVVRYERKTSAEQKRAVAVIRQSIREVTSLLSQRLVHIEAPEASLPADENFGVELRLTVFPSQGMAHDLTASRIWFQAKDTKPQQLESSPSSKPYCLLSVRNHLECELHGVIGPNADSSASGQLFIAHASTRLVAGWDCIEVFPGLDLSPWNADVAPLWAECDILGAALIAHTKAAQLANLDPRASTRRHYAALLAEFRALLDSNPDREQILHSFLQSNSALLCPTHVQMWSKLQLGATVTDFVFRDANHDYLLVELERSILKLFRKDGHATSDLTHAQGQIVDWKRYIEDNLQTAQRELGLVGITANPSGLLVIGRSSSLLPRDRRKLQAMGADSLKLRIMTYDDVYENAKAVLENLLGPIWDAGGSTQIYYPLIE